MQLFLTSHIIGFLGFMFFTYVHYPPSFWYVPGLLLYFLDVTFRISQLGVTSGVQCSFVSAKRTFVTLRLKFNKVNIPAISDQFLDLLACKWTTPQQSFMPYGGGLARPGAGRVSCACLGQQYLDALLKRSGQGRGCGGRIRRIAVHDHRMRIPKGGSG